MRRGEVLGVQWADVDLERGVLAVRRARVAAGYQVATGDTKSGHARTISLGASTAARLREQRRVQLEAHLRRGLPRAEHVVIREDGALPHPQMLSYYFDQAVAEMGLPRMRFHDRVDSHKP